MTTPGTTSPLPPSLPAARTATRTTVRVAVTDAVLVLAFVLIGRASHGEGLLATLETYWPFLVGLTAGWLLTRAWRHPLAVVPTGLVIWVSTVLAGLGLRFATGQGTQLSFMIVTAVVLGVFLLGWRAVTALIRRRRRAAARG